MTVENQSNQSSTLTICPPPLTPKSHRATEFTPPTQANLILVIDDDLIIRKLLKAYLDSLGYQAAVASNGEEGINLAKQLHPHAILLDVMMPGIDGWMVLSTLKKDPDLANIPIIMVSIMEDQKLGTLLGATEYLVKPIRRDELNVILKKHLHTGDQQEVLLVEDEVLSQRLLESMLKDAGWQVHAAENGRVALDYLKKQKPQLILTDLIMPEMDGFEFIQRLRQHPAWRKIPVVVLTAKKMTEEEQRKLTGCVVEKVFQKDTYHLEDLLSEIKKCLK